MMADGSLARGVGHFGFHVDHIVFKSFHPPNLPEIREGAITTIAVRKSKTKLGASLPMLPVHAYQPNLPVVP